MREVEWWLALVSLVLGVVGAVPTLVYIRNRVGRVRFYPSDWRMGFWKSSHPPGLILVFTGDDNRTSPDRAGMMECSFSVKILNGKSVDTTLHRVAAVFRLPGGSTHSAEIYDPEARNVLESLHLPAKQPVTKELWIHIYVSDVGRETMVKLASPERVVFEARYPWAGATESRFTHRSQGAPGGDSGGNLPR